MTISQRPQHLPRGQIRRGSAGGRHGPAPTGVALGPAPVIDWPGRQPSPLFAAITPAERAALMFEAWMIALTALVWRAPGPPLSSPEWMLLDTGLIALLLAAAQWRSPPAAGLRPLIALFLVVPLGYTEAGHFGTRLAPNMEPVLIGIDQRWFHVNWWGRHPPPPGAWSGMLEATYLLNYLLIFGWPLWKTLELGLSRQSAAPARRSQLLLSSVVGAVVTALLACYAVFPLLPAVTPRLYFPQLRQMDPGGLVRGVNYFLLAHGAVPWGILPSGHVAGPAAMGSSFLIRRQWRWAAIYLGAAGLIAVAVVHGNYHFVADDVSGGLVGLAAAAVVDLQLRRRLRRTPRLALVGGAEMRQG